MYQSAYGLWQAFNYCAIREETVVIERQDGYAALADNPDGTQIANFLLGQISPSRFNIIPDAVAAVLAGYFNNWLMAAWFAAAWPVNLGYELYFLADPMADMPPAFQFGKTGQYADVVN